MPAKKTPSPAKIADSFEEAADELEEITQRLEDEPSSLAKLLEDFERGQALLSYCQKTLLSARKRLTLVEAKLQAGVPAEASDDDSDTDFTEQDDDVRLF